jgi:hypothetical protein
MTHKIFQTLCLSFGLSLALMGAPIQAKLPAPSAEAKVKADEAKAKAAETAKVEAELLSKYAVKLKAEGKEFKPTAIPAPAPAVAAPTAPVAVVAPTAPAALPAAAPKK